MPEAKLPKKQAREQARVLAQEMRVVEAKRKRRRLILWQTGITTALIAAATIIVLVIATAPAPTTGLGPKNMANDQITLTGNNGNMTTVPTGRAKIKGNVSMAKETIQKGKVHITEYVDFQCPYCQQFEQANSAQITSWVKAGQATLSVHPIAILNNSSQGNKYSTRSANAAACVANYDPNNFYKVFSTLYANQPQEGTGGLSDSQIIAILAKGGVTDSSVTGCVTGQTFVNWVTAETQRAINGPIPNADISSITQTPTVIVNGVTYKGSSNDPTAFASFVSAQAYK